MLADKSPGKVALSLGLSCRNLQSKFLGGSKNHFLSAYELYEGSWTQLGSTEVVHNDPDPSFSTPIKADYYQGRHQRIVIEVFEFISPKSKSSLQSKLLSSGHAEFDLDDLVENCLDDQMCLPLTSRKVPLKNSAIKTRGTLQIRFDKILKSSLIQIRIQGEKMNSLRFCSDNNNTLEIYKPKNVKKFSTVFGDQTSNFDLANLLLSDDDWVLIFRSESINYNPMVIWKTFEINNSRLTSCNNDLPLKIVVKDYSLKSGKHKVVGSTLKTFNELVTGFHKRETEAIMLKSPSGKNSGQLRVMHLSQGILHLIS